MHKTFLWSMGLVATVVAAYAASRLGGVELLGVMMMAPAVALFAVVVVSDSEVSQI